MKEKLLMLYKKVFTFLENHIVIVSGIVIYGYYLLTTLDLFEHHTVKKTFVEYLLQFDSLFLLWLLAVVTVQLQKYRQHKREEEEYRKQIEREFDRQRLHLQILDEITALLQENVNNPLAVISITAHNIRRRFETDDEIANWLDRIDVSLKRIHAIVDDVKSFQTQKIVQETTEKAERPKKVA